MCPRHWQAQDDQVISRQQEVDARLCDLADCPTMFLPGSRFSASVTVGLWWQRIKIGKYLTAG